MLWELTENFLKDMNWFPFSVYILFLSLFHQIWKSLLFSFSFSLRSSHLIWARPEDEQVKGDSRYDVDEEPALEIVLGDATRMAHHLVVTVHVGGPEVDDDIDDEHDVHHQVHHIERIAGVSAVGPALSVVLAEQEGGAVRREHSRVQHEQQDQPIPYGLERAVVQDRPLVDARRLQLVLGQHVGSQRQHLKRAEHPWRA